MSLIFEDALDCVGGRTELGDGGPENDPLLQLMEGGEDDPDTGDASLVGPVCSSKDAKGGAIPTD